MSDKILFVTIPEKGHVNPMIGVAQHLEQRGYELAFFSQGDISLQLRQACLKGADYSAKGPPKLLTQGKAFAEKINDKAWLRSWIKMLLIDAVIPQVNILQGVIEQVQPRLIVADPMVYAAAISAHQYAIPWAGLSSSLNPITPAEWKCELTDFLEVIDSERLALLKSFGLDARFKISDLISPWLNLVFSTEAYMPRAFCGNDFSHYCGDCFPLYRRGDETEFPFDKLHPQKKKVYMSLGSQIYYQPQLFQAVAEALNGCDIQLIFSMGGLCHTSFPQTLPKNTLCVAYTPQVELLKHMDLMITHGGANSVMECLALGIPVALLPLCNDQFLQAEFVKRAEVGIILDPNKADATRYREQLLPLLEDRARFNVQHIARSFKAYRGASLAADLVERLFQTQQPLKVDLETPALPLSAS